MKDESLKHSLFAAYNTNYTSDQGEAAVRVEWLRPHASGWPRAWPRVGWPAAGEGTRSGSARTG